MTFFKIYIDNILVLCTFELWIARMATKIMVHCTKTDIRRFLLRYIILESLSNQTEDISKGAAHR